MPQFTEEQKRKFAEYSTKARSCSDAFQAGAFIANECKNPQLARRLNAAGVGLVSISSGLAIFAANPILGTANFLLGGGALGLGLFGGDANEDGLGPYLEERFAQVLQELYIIRQDIAELDAREQQRFLHLCDKIDAFCRHFDEAQHRIHEAFYLVADILHELRSEATAYYQELTAQHGEQNLQHYVSKLEEKIRRYQSLRSNFDARVMSARQTKQAVARAVDKTFIQIYDEIQSLITSEIARDALPPVKSPLLALTYLQQEDSSCIDIAWLCDRINGYLGREIRATESIPYYPISIPQEMTLMNRSLLIETADLLCHALDIRYQPTNGHVARLPSEAFALVQQMQRQFVAPYLQLLTEFEKNKTLPRLFGLYLGAIDFYFKQAIQYQIKEFETKQTHQAKEQLRKNIALTRTAKEVLLQRLNNQELACNQVMSAYEVVYRNILQWPGQDHGCAIANTRFFSFNNLPAEVAFHLRSSEYHSLQLKTEVAKSHQEHCEQAFDMPEPLQQTWLEQCQFHFFSAPREIAPPFSYYTMSPDTDTQPRINLIFKVPPQLSIHIPVVVQESIASGLTNLIWSYAIEEAHPEKMQVTAHLSLGHNTNLIKVLCIEIFNPLVSLHKAPFPFQRQYSTQESWLLFFHGGYYARSSKSIAFDFVCRGTIKEMYSIPLIPNTPEKGFIHSVDGTFDGAQCLQIIAELLPEDEERLNHYQHHNSSHETFQQELTRSFLPKGRNEQAFTCVNDIFYTLLALIEFIQPVNYQEYTAHLKMLHEKILQSVHHGIESLAEIDQAYEAIEQITQKMGSKPTADHALIKIDKTLAHFSRRWEHSQATFSVYTEEDTTTHLILQLQASIANLEKTMLQMQTPSESSLTDKADDLYVRGKIAHTIEKTEEAVRFFSLARTQYKKILRATPALSESEQKKLIRRITKTEDDGKYSMSRLLK